MEYTAPETWSVVSDLRFGLGLSFARLGDIQAAREEWTLALETMQDDEVAANSDTAAAVRRHLSQLGAQSAAGTRVASLAWKIRQRLRKLIGR